MLTYHIVFEDKEYRERMVSAVEKNITYDNNDNMLENQPAPTQPSKVV